MGELMHDALGVGLAATQLGVLHRVLVYRAYAEDPVTALVNPELEWRARSSRWPKRAASACRACTSRSSARRSVRVRAQDAQGEELEIEAEGLEARVIQHEIDHLDGVLILDRISTRGAQGGDARDARGRRKTRERRRSAPPSGSRRRLSDRLPRHLRVRRRGARAARRQRRTARRS